MIDQRLSEREVIEVAVAPQAHMAAEVLALHVLEQLVGAVEAQRLRRVAAVVAELARRVAAHVRRQLGRRPGSELQRERPMLLRTTCRSGHQPNDMQPQALSSCHIRSSQAQCC